jgi:hypothetical protein
MENNMITQKRYHLGLFDSIETDVLVRKLAEKKYHGDYAVKEQKTTGEV